MGVMTTEEFEHRLDKLCSEYISFLNTRCEVLEQDLRINIPFEEEQRVRLHDAIAKLLGIGRDDPDLLSKLYNLDRIGFDVRGGNAPKLGLLTSNLSHALINLKLIKDIERKKGMIKDDR